MFSLRTCGLALAFALPGLIGSSAEAAPTVTSTSAASKPTVLVVPLAGATKALQDLGYAAAFRTIGVFQATNGFNLMHPKQLARALESRSALLGDVRTADGLRKASVWLGARWAVTGVLAGAGKKTTIKLLAMDVASGKKLEADIPAADTMVVIDAMSEKSLELLDKLGMPGAAAALAARPKALASASPMTQNAGALGEYGACARILMQQPISIRDPVLLEGAALDDGITHCKTAASLDADFVDARAALGFAYALKGDQKLAEEYLASVKNARGFLPDYAIGRFWVLNKYYDTNMAVEALEQVVEKHPNFMIARGYLGDSLNILKRHDAALEVFHAYLAEVPDQPWVMSRIGYTYAKLKNFDAAVEWTKKALRVTPADPELLLEMASRFVDAGRYDDARTVLARIVADGGARGEVYLRLGYVYLLSGKLADAERELHKALRLATKQSEWRTRGRARYDLAKLWICLLYTSPSPRD